MFLPQSEIAGQLGLESELSIASGSPLTGDKTREEADDLLPLFPVKALLQRRKLRGRAWGWYHFTRRCSRINSNDARLIDAVGGRSGRQRGRSRAYRKPGVTGSAARYGDTRGQGWRAVGYVSERVTALCRGIFRQYFIDQARGFAGNGCTCRAAQLRET